MYVKLKRELFVVRLLTGLQKAAFNTTFASALCLSCKQDLNRGVLLLQHHTQQCTASDAAEPLISTRFGVFLTLPLWNCRGHSYCTTSDSETKTRALSCLLHGRGGTTAFGGVLLWVFSHTGEMMTNTTESCLWLTWEPLECFCSQPCMHFAQGEEGGVIPNSQLKHWWSPTLSIEAKFGSVVSL